MSGSQTHVHGAPNGPGALAPRGDKTWAPVSGSQTHVRGAPNPAPSHPGETRPGLPCQAARRTSAGLQMGPAPSHPGETRPGLPCQAARRTSAGLQTGPAPSQELASWSREPLGAKSSPMRPPPARELTLLSVVGAGCQPDHSAGTRAAGGPRGSQVRGGHLLPAPGGAAPPAVPQVSQPAGGPRPGSPCNPFLSPRRRRAEPAAEGRHCPGVSASLKVLASVRGCVPVPEAVES